MIGILTEQDSVQGILLLRYACKSSLQIDAGEGKIKLIPPWKVILSSLSFFSVGYLFLINLVFVIVKADDVLSLFFDIVALVRYAFTSCCINIHLVVYADSTSLVLFILHRLGDRNSS